MLRHALLLDRKLDMPKPIKQREFSGLVDMWRILDFAHYLRNNWALKRKKHKNPMTIWGKESSCRVRSSTYYQPI
jgi:hypothetical protein